MTHDHAMCPDASPESAEWTDAQAIDRGHCEMCEKRNVNRRIEPFSGMNACKECWELVVYGEDDEP